MKQHKNNRTYIQIQFQVFLDFNMYDFVSGVLMHKHRFDTADIMGLFLTVKNLD
jgi:hypothetical protein